MDVDGLLLKLFSRAYLTEEDTESSLVWLFLKCGFAVIFGVHKGKRLLVIRIVSDGITQCSCGVWNRRVVERWLGFTTQRWGFDNFKYFNIVCLMRILVCFLGPCWRRGFRSGRLLILSVHGDQGALPCKKSKVSGSYETKVVSVGEVQVLRCWKGLTPMECKGYLGVFGNWGELMVQASGFWWLLGWEEGLQDCLWACCLERWRREYEGVPCR